MAPVTVAEVRVENIVKILIEDDKLLNNWSSFYESLELQGIDKKPLDNQVKQGFPLKSVFTETLKLWVGEGKGTEERSVEELATILDDDEYIRTASILRKDHGDAQIVKRLSKKPTEKEEDKASTSDISLLNGKQTTHDFTNNIISLNVNVTKSKKRIGQGDPKVYQVNSTPKGCALIISNFEFKDLCDDRPGGKQDGDYMYHLLSQLGFKCIHKPNLSSEELEKAIQDFQTELISTKSDSLIVVVMSHGKQDYILMRDGVFVHRLHHIAYKFNASNFPEFHNVGQPDKPKLFFMAACEVLDHFGKDMPLLKDPRSTDPLMNALMVTATLPGYSANRDVYLGTHFIYCLAYVFMKHAHNTELEEMLRLVKDDMLNIVSEIKQPQIPLITKMGFDKKFYFNPGGL